MTKEILDSDVEFAQRLLEEGRLDSEVTKALARRGVEAVKAAQVVADLKNGRLIRPNKMILLPRRIGSRRQ